MYTKFYKIASKILQTLSYLTNFKAQKKIKFEGNDFKNIKQLIY